MPEYFIRLIPSVPLYNKSEVCLFLHTARCSNVATFGHLAPSLGTRAGDKADLNKVKMNRDERQGK